MPSGAVSKYSQELADRYVELLAQGAEHAKAAKQIGFTPGAVWRWRDEHPEFQERCIRAMQVSVEGNVDKLLHIFDYFPDTNQARVMSTNIQWVASKVMPHVYGDRVAIDFNGRLDLSNVLNAAEQRAKELRGRCDAGNVVDAEIVDVNGVESKGITGQTPVILENPNDFNTPEIPDPLGLLK